MGPAGRGWFAETERRLVDWVEQYLGPADSLDDCAQHLCATRMDRWLELQATRSWLRAADLRGILQMPTAVRWELLGVATMTGSGYVREPAVTELREAPAPRAVHYALPRCCDWVAPIRSVAVEVLRMHVPQLATHELAELVVSALPWLTRRLRPEAAEVADLLSRQLERPERLPQLRALRRADDRRVRLLATQATIDDVLADPDECRWLLRDPSVAVRMQVVHGLLAAPEAAQRVASDVMQNANVRVVARFAMACEPSLLEAHRDRLHRMACASRSVRRGIGRWALARLGERPEQRVREALERGDEVSPGALLCLRDGGRREDAALVAPYAEREDPSLRAAAIAAICGLAGIPLERLLELLCDEQRLVRKVAARAICALPRWRWATAVRAVVRRHPHARTEAFAALVKGAASMSWQALPDLLAAALHFPDRARCEDQLASWMDRNLLRGWRKPDAPTVTALRDVWPAWSEDPRSAEPRFADLASCVRPVLLR